MSTQCRSPEPEPPRVYSLSGAADRRIAKGLAMICSLIRLKAGAPSVDGAHTFLTEIGDRIETVAQLHRLIARSTGANVRLSRYLQEICERLIHALTPGDAAVSVACAPERSVPCTTALLLGLITAELVSNSLKYAHPSGLPVKITLSCSRSPEGQLGFSYADDGVGFPEGFDAAHDGQQGMQFIRLFSEQLGGTHAWPDDSLGVRFELSIPMPADDVSRMRHSGLSEVEA